MKKVVQSSIFGILILFLTCTSNTIYSQTNNKYSLDKGTIDNQFLYILTNASKYEDYKVVKEGWLWVLKGHVTDTIKLLHKEIGEDKIIIGEKNTTIDSLRAELAKTNDIYNTTFKEKNSLRFLGILLSKAAYNSLVWTIILILAFMVVILFLLFKRSNSTTVQTKLDLQELKNEFETHRKQAIDREQKMARQHLNELLKYKK